MDNVSRLVRSRTMAAVKSTGNRSTERVLRARLVRSGVRGWRMHARDVAGGPDFVFDGPRVAVFVDGCFWHGCPTHAVAPKNNGRWWADKLAANRARDERTDRDLAGADWLSLRVWEHEVTCVAADRVAEAVSARRPV